MTNLNQAMIIGNVTRDPDIRTTADGQRVALFSVATNRAWTEPSGMRKEQVEFHSVVAWRKLAEILESLMHKGSKVFVQGRLQTRSWEDPSGQKKYRTEIIAEQVIVLDRRGDTAPLETPEIAVDEFRDTTLAL